MGYFIFPFLPVYQTPLSVIRFHEFRSIGEGSRREKIATGTSPPKNHLTRTTRRKAARRNVASWWHIGGEREREGKKRNIFLVFHFHRANFFPAVSFDFDRSRSRRFSVFPPMENAFPLTQIREGAEEQNDAGKMGKRYTTDGTSNE